MQPRAGQGIDVDEIGDVEKPPDNRCAPGVQALSPVQVGCPEFLVTEGWLGKTHITDVAQVKSADRAITVGMPVLEFVNQRAGIACAIAGQVPASVLPHHATAGGVIGAR